MKTAFAVMVVNSAALAAGSYDPDKFNPSALMAGATLSISDMDGLYPALIIVIALVTLICGTGVLMRFRRKLRNMQRQIDRLCGHVKQLEAVESRRLMLSLKSPPLPADNAHVLPIERAPDLAPDQPIQDQARIG